MGKIKRFAAYTWAAPNSFLGLLVVIITIITGGKSYIRNGAIEAYGGFATWLMKNLKVKAMTIGHVILGLNDYYLDENRDHELAHVKQYELFGPIFLPAYAASSLWAIVRGKHYYKDNWFEIDADKRSEKALS